MKAKNIVEQKRFLIVARRGHPLFSGASLDFVDEEKSRFLLSDVAKGRLDHEIVRYWIKRFRLNGGLLFLNPYGGRDRRVLDLYRQVRKFGSVPYLVLDKGALNGSWFVDPNGFNGDSVSYSPLIWDRSLAGFERDRAETLISKVNFARLGAHEEIDTNPSGLPDRKLTADSCQKTVLFLLQTRADATVTFLGGRFRNYRNFIGMIQLLSSVRPNFRFIVRFHPLDREVLNWAGFQLEGVEFSSADLYEDFDSADAVVTLTSGAGLLAAIYGKPTFIFGQAFYAHPGIATLVAGPWELLARLENPEPPAPETIRRFILHLDNYLYYSVQSSREFAVEENTGTSFLDIGPIKWDQVRKLRYFAHLISD